MTGDLNSDDAGKETPRCASVQYAAANLYEIFHLLPDNPYETPKI